MDDLGRPVEKYVDEDDILRDYFPYWSTKMRYVGKYELINLENCIKDFCVVHWATEV